MDPSFAKLFDLSGKVALVTGAFARGLAPTWRLPPRRQELIDQTAKTVRSFGGRSSAITADITVDEQMEALFRRVAEEFGRIDILVNNAGYTDRSGLRHDQSSTRRIRSIVELDLLATINDCRLAA